MRAGPLLRSGKKKRIKLHRSAAADGAADDAAMAQAAASGAEPLEDADPAAAAGVAPNAVGMSGGAALAPPDEAGGGHKGASDGILATPSDVRAAPDLEPGQVDGAGPAAPPRDKAASEAAAATLAAQHEGDKKAAKKEKKQKKEKREKKKKDKKEKREKREMKSAEGLGADAAALASPERVGAS